MSVANVGSSQAAAAQAAAAHQQQQQHQQQNTVQATGAEAHEQAARERVETQKVQATEGENGGIINTYA